MALPFKELKYCDNRTVNLVNGYIHNAQRLLPWSQNSYFIIPEIIHRICLAFYWLQFAINTEFIGDNLKIIGARTVLKEKKDSHSMCAIGKSISRSICDIFRIEYTMKHTNKDRFCPVIGFCGASVIDSSSGIKWNHRAPGYSSQNGISSVGINIYRDMIRKDKKYPGRTWIYKDGTQSYKYKLELNDELKVGDRFMLEFNFIQNKCHIYYNSRHTGCVIPFDYKQIIPLLSLYFVGEMIEITKYEFCDWM